MSAKTQCITPVSLRLAVRNRFLESSLFIEPAWVGSTSRLWPPVPTGRHSRTRHGHDSRQGYLPIKKCAGRRSNKVRITTLKGRGDDKFVGERFRRSRQLRS